MKIEIKAATSSFFISLFFFFFFLQPVTDDTAAAAAALDCVFVRKLRIRAGKRLKEYKRQREKKMVGAKFVAATTTS